MTVMPKAAKVVSYLTSVRKNQVFPRWPVGQDQDRPRLRRKAPLPASSARWRTAPPRKQFRIDKIVSSVARLSLTVELAKHSGSILASHPAAWVRISA